MDDKSLEFELRRHRAVADCYVWHRPATSPEFEAYVALRNREDVRTLADHLKARFKRVPPLLVIPVSGIPLTAHGVVDKDALSLAREAHLRGSTLRDCDMEVRPDLQHETIQFEETGAGVSSEYNPTSSGAPLPVASIRSIEAFSEGPELILNAESPATLTDALMRTVHLHPKHGITYIHSDGTERFQSYRALMDESQCLLGALFELQLPVQSKIIFQFDDNADFIPAFWACLLGGYVPVPIAVPPVFETGNAVVEKLVNAWKVLQFPPILTSERIAEQLDSVFQAEGVDAFRIATIESMKSHVPTMSLHKSSADDLAILLLTSGSTGIPKGVRLTHRNILSNIAASAQVNGFGPDDISLNWLRLDHVGSLVRCSIRDVYVGSNQIHAPAELVLEAPLRLLDWIERYSVTFAWAPNFALGLINKELRSASQRRWDLSSLRSMLSVAEAIIPKTAQTFVRLLAPHGFKEEMMHAAWGMSETCAAVTFSHNYLARLPQEDYPYVEVGAPTAGFKMRIVDAVDRIVSEGVVGRLQIQGPMVLSGYYDNPELNASEFSADGWFKTGDLGYIKEGRLTVNGREKDIIIINGLNHSCPEIEAIVEEVDGVLPSYTAACGLRQAGQDTDQLVVFFGYETENAETLKALLRAVQSTISRKLGIQAAYLLPVDSALIPKTSSGKIQRLKLKERFEEGEFAGLVKEIAQLMEAPGVLPGTLTTTELQLANIWKEVLGLKAVQREDDFFELGGTSVLAARLFILIEQKLGKTLPLASLFQAPKLVQLAEMVDEDLEAPGLWNSLVPIRPEGKRPPLFFIHAGFGDVVGFEGMLRYIDEKWPVYALRPIDLGGQCEPLPTIEEMAAHYRSEIMKVFPRGPYHLVGHCSGGSIAYEMAQQLTAQGHRVGLLAMNDTPFPVYKNYLRTRMGYYDHSPLYKTGLFDRWYYESVFCYWVRPYQLLGRLKGHARAFRENKMIYIKKAWLSLGGVFRRRDSRSGGNLAARQTDLKSSKPYIDERFFESFLRAEQRYVPKPFDGSIDYFLTVQNTYGAVGRPHSLRSFRQNTPVHSETKVRFGWDKLVGEEHFRIHLVDCRHEDMLLEPSMPLLCEQLSHVLKDL